MRQIDVYRRLNRNMIDTIERVNVLTKVELPPKRKYQPVRPSPYLLTKEAEEYQQVVTAHKLSQYIHRIHHIQIKDNLTTWLDLLIEDVVKKKEEYRL